MQHYVGHHYTQTTTNNAKLGGKDEQNIVFMWVPGFSGIRRTREGPRFSITFALYAKKIFISRVSKCVTRNVFTMCRKQTYIYQYVKIGED